MTVKVGTDASGKPLSSIDLYPEGYVESFVFTNEYCGGSTKRCPPSFRGQWNFNDSKTTIQNIDDKPAPISAYESRVAWSQTDTATEILDTLSLNTTAGLVEVANTTISAIHDENLRLPNGTSYQPAVGMLSSEAQKEQNHSITQPDGPSPATSILKTSYPPTPLAYTTVPLPQAQKAV